MTLSRPWSILGLLVSALAMPAAGRSTTAASSAAADAILEIRPSLTFAVVRPPGTVGAAREGQGVFVVTGDAHRAYRVAPLDPKEAGTIISDNAGDVTATGLARLDAAGRDVLRIRLPDAAARPALSIAYE